MLCNFSSFFGSGTHNTKCSLQIMIEIIMMLLGPKLHTPTPFTLKNVSESKQAFRPFLWKFYFIQQIFSSFCQFTWYHEQIEITCYEWWWILLYLDAIFCTNNVDKYLQFQVLLLCDKFRIIISVPLSGRFSKDLKLIYLVFPLYISFRLSLPLRTAFLQLISEIHTMCLVKITNDDTNED